MSDLDERNGGVTAKEIAQAERVVDDPAMKGTIAHYGSMLLLAKLGRMDRLRLVLPDLKEALQLAIENIRLFEG